jgi:hypothetical protein
MVRFEAGHAQGAAVNGPRRARTLERPVAGLASQFGIFAINLERSPDRYAAKALRRFLLRLSLWRAAAQGSPAALLSARPARWWPEGFPRQVPTAAAATRQ